MSRLFVRPMVIGRENLDQQGAMLVAATHRSEFDFIALFAPIVKYRADVTFLAMAKLFYSPIARVVLRWFGIIPVDRGTAAAIEASKQGISVLDEGGVVILFPEGKISTTGEMLPVKSGAAYMALATGTPVVPVALVGTDRVKRVGTSPLHWGWGRRYVVVIGSPISVPNRGEESTKAERDQLTNTVAARLTQLEKQGRQAIAV